jgi:hypothetical protein
MAKNFDQMGKEELRAACRKAGIPYGKLNNDGMRDALKKLKEQLKQQLEQQNPGAVVVSPSVAQQEEVKSEPAQAPQGEMWPQMLGRGTRPVTTGTVVAPKSLKIEKGRESRNGVTRPSAGSICREIWDKLDARRAELEAVPTFEHVRELMKANGWQRNTAFTQFQRWKQFNGVMPRSTEGLDEGAEPVVADQDEGEGTEE